MITFPHKITNLFIQFDWHKGIYLPPIPPVPGFSFHMGGGCLIMARFGGVNNENDRKVFADGVEVVSRDHEVKGLVFPHMSLPPVPADLLMPLHILGSSSKCKFAATSVMMKDGPMAVSVLWGHVGLNVACNDRVLPPTCLVHNWGTVHVGFTWADLIAAVLLYAFDLLIEWILGAIAEKLASLIPSGLKKALFRGPLLALSEMLGLSGWRMLTRYRALDGTFRSLSEYMGNMLIETGFKDLGSMGFDASGVGDFVSDSVDGFANWVTGNSQPLSGSP